MTPMRMVLLDWTRMGSNYCLAGAVALKDSFRIVRPLPAMHRGAPVRNVGWSPHFLETHERWEWFDLLDPEPAAREAPHVEDVWVRAIRPLRNCATASERKAILTATSHQA